MNLFPTPFTPESSATVAVIVSTHRQNLLPEEQVSLRHLMHYLGGYDLYLIHPQSCRFSLPGFRYMPLPDEYFESRRVYSGLMLRRDFYESFAAYQYILTYHLDALVFSDSLPEWCAKGYDYIGAPWFKSPNDPAQGFLWVGNGGFALKKVSSFLALLDSERHRHDRWGLLADVLRLHLSEFYKRKAVIVRELSQDIAAGAEAAGPSGLARRVRHRLDEVVQPLRGVSSYIEWREEKAPCTEDYFWGHYAKPFYPEFRVAPAEVAVQFAFEAFPDYCFEYNQRRLPFGCHAWYQLGREFWTPHLLK
jgi:hypothetical protein